MVIFYSKPLVSRRTERQGRLRMFLRHLSFLFGPVEAPSGDWWWLTVIYIYTYSDPTNESDTYKMVGFRGAKILYPMDPSSFLGSVWGMIWRVKYLLRQCLDP